VVRKVLPQHSLRSWAFPACPSFGPLCMCSVRICTMHPRHGHTTPANEHTLTSYTSRSTFLRTFTGLLKAEHCLVHGIHVNHARNTCSDDSRTIATGSTFGSRIGPSDPTTGSLSGFGQIPVVVGSPLLGYRELYESNLFVSLPNDGACHGVRLLCSHS
jgi:hypothetical protein